MAGAMNGAAKGSALPNLFDRKRMLPNGRGHGDSTSPELAAKLKAGAAQAPNRNVDTLAAFLGGDVDEGIEDEPKEADDATQPGVGLATASGAVSIKGRFAGLRYEAPPPPEPTDAELYAEFRAGFRGVAPGGTTP